MSQCQIVLLTLVFGEGEFLAEEFVSFDHVRNEK